MSKAFSCDLMGVNHLCDDPEHVMHNNFPNST